MRLDLGSRTAVAALLAIATGVATPAHAKCVTSGTTTTCDTTPPNPDPVPATNVNVKVLSGAGVSAVNVLANGSLAADAASTITGPGDTALLAQNATGTVAGTIRATAPSSQGVVLSTGTTLNVSQGGLVESSGVVSGVGPPRSAAIATAPNAQVTINVDGTVRTTASDGAGIALFSKGAQPPARGYGTGTINVGVTGLVEATGPRAAAIEAAGGSVVNVAGTVRATGASPDGVSNAIRADGDLTINALEGGLVTATQSPAIASIAGRVYVTVAGTVAGPAGGAAISLGSNSQVTLLPTARITGYIAATTLSLLAPQGTSGTYDVNANLPVVFSLLKEGPGTYTLSGQFDRNFGMVVSAGTLVDNATLPSTSLRVDPAGRLEGSGTLNYLEVLGTIAPGGAGFGTFTVPGGPPAPLTSQNIAIEQGAIYEVTANAAGAADLITTIRAARIESGTTVRVLAQSGTYAPLTQYVILHADNGVSGTFSTVTSNFAFLSPTLSYTATEVRLLLVRNDLHFADAAQTANQRSTGQALERVGFPNPLFLAIVGQSAEGARSAFDALSGEIYPSLVTYLTQESRLARRGLLDAAAVAPAGLAVWGEAGRTWTRDDADSAFGTAAGRGDANAVEGGFTYRSGGFVAALGAGGYDQDYRLAARSSRASVKTLFFGGDVGYGFGPVKLAAGYGYGAHRARIVRDILFGGFGSTGARTDGHTSQIFADAAYDFSAGRLRGAVFAGYAHVDTALDAFQETANLGRLSVARETMKTGFLRGGLRLGLDLPASGALTIAPRASLAYVGTTGDRRGLAAMAFQGQATSFAVAGAPLPRRAVEARAGLDFVAKAVRIGLSYDGLIGSHWQDHGARFTGSFAF